MSEVDFNTRYNKLYGKHNLQDIIIKLENYATLLENIIDEKSRKGSVEQEGSN